MGRRATRRTSNLRRALAVTVLVAASAGPSVARAADVAQAGRWSAPFWEGRDAPFDPPSADRTKRFPTAGTVIALPDGRVLYWNALEGSENNDVWLADFDSASIALENARVRLLDLDSRGGPAWTTSTFERGLTAEADAGRATHDLFCSDQKLLYDGRVLVAGGSRWDRPEDSGVPEPRGVKDTSVFDPADDTFHAVEDMREPRWYPSLATLADGRVLVTSGVRRAGYTFANPEPSFSQVRLSEIYDPQAGTWEDAGTSRWSFPLYPRLHLMPDGKVFYGGAGQAWNPLGETADETTWGERRMYDPAAETWSGIGQARYGMRSGAASVLLRLEPPYRHADVLMAGGTLGASPSTWAATTLSEVVRWTREGIRNLGETESPAAGLLGESTQLRNRRWFGNGVLLPTGEVMLVNGGDADDVLDPGSAGAVRTPELYDPESGTWTELAPAGRDRVYHNTAVLLPDGRVLVGGNAPHTAHYTRYDNTLTRSNNFRDSTFEIYEPPYLFRGDRPVLERVKPVKAGRALRLKLGRGTAGRDISEVVLVRMGSNTHSMDADLRAVELRHTRSRAAITARLPRGGDGRLLPPGPYYVFAVRGTTEGPVPSIARVVLIQPGAGHRVVARRAP